MKMSFIKSVSALALTVVGASLLPYTADAAAWMSPTGVTWDCVVNGAQGRGLAQIEFYEDFTFGGITMITANPPAPAPSTPAPNPRGGGVDTRNGTGSTNVVVVTKTMTNIFGSLPVEGRWNYDAKGQVIGYFQQVITNVGSSYTNSIWFKAIVTPRQLTLVATLPGGRKSTYAGLHQTEMPDLSGYWYGNEKGAGQKLLEFFDVYPTTSYGIYDIYGEGPGYLTAGQMMISSRKRLAIVTTDNVSGNLRATVGTYYPVRRQGLTTGIKSPSSRVTYNTYHYPND